MKKKYVEADKINMKLYPDVHQKLLAYVLKHRLKSNGAAVEKLLEESKK